MNALASPPLNGLARYPLNEAARLTQLDVRTARRWALGYNYRHHGEVRSSRGVLALAGRDAAAEPALTFAEMLTLRLVKGFREARLSLATIKRVAEVAAREFGTPVPFVSKRFRTDGRRVFLELQHTAPANDEPALPPHERRMIDVLTGQGEFAEVVEPSLFANVDWQDEIATRWWPLGQGRSVVLDPATLFGAPRIADSRVPTSAVAQAVQAEGSGDASISAVAEWYGISAAQVRDALTYETAWLAKAA